MENLSTDSRACANAIVVGTADDVVVIVFVVIVIVVAVLQVRGGMTGPKVSRAADVETIAAVITRKTKNWLTMNIICH